MPQPEAPEDPPPLRDDLGEEAERVRDWRLAELLRADIGYDLALTIASSSADYRAVIRAHDRGCPDELLKEVFL